MADMGPPGGSGSPPMELPGPPYPPATAQLGGVPTVQVDDPICAVLLLLFAVSAATHMTIFQINLKRDHKFIFSVLLFAFSMARVAALVMRIVWASRPTDANVALAASILTVAGVIILFLVNLFFAQRMVRAYHPNFGWHGLVRWAFRFLLFCAIASLVMAVVSGVQSSFTLDPATRRSDRTVQLVASTTLAALAFVPIPICALAAAARRRGQRPEKFGQGRFRAKMVLLLSTATLLSMGAGFRTGVAYDARPPAQPAWFHHKAAFYIFNFGLELAVVYAYAIARFDRRFHVPNGSSGPGHYAGEYAARHALRNKGKNPGGRHLRFSPDRINTEADVFGGDPGAADTDGRLATVDNASIPRLTREWEEKLRDEVDRTSRMSEADDGSGGRSV